MNGIVCSDIPRTRRIKIIDLNPHLMCVLCGGYYIDATTIIECLHSFCKTCIVRYLETSKFCPICDVQVHKTKPLLNIRSDQTLQDIVYKLVPGLFQREMKRRRDFYAKHPHDDDRGLNPRSNEERGEVESDFPRNIFMPDEFISIALEYSESGGISNSPDKDEHREKSLHICRHYLRCPVYITVAHIKKLVRAKYNLSTEHRVDILFSQDNLNDGFMLMDITYMYAWKRKGPLKLFFRIFEQPPKRLKTYHIATPTTASPFRWERTKNPNGSANKSADAPPEAAAIVTIASGEPPSSEIRAPPSEQEKATETSATVPPSSESQSASCNPPAATEQSTVTTTLTTVLPDATSKPTCPTATVTGKSNGVEMTEVSESVNNNNNDDTKADENEKLKKRDAEERSKPAAGSEEDPGQNLPNGDVSDSITLSATSAAKDEKSLLDKVNGVTANGTDNITIIQIYSK